MVEARWYEKAAGDVVRCGLCAQGCRIGPGGRGLCRVRENRAGRLYSLVYGQVAAEAVDPVEKKPLYHFLPRTRTWSIATPGCNFRCLHCQNHRLSQVGDRSMPATVRRRPGDVAVMALAAGCKSVSYTYSEPTVFLEFAEDCGLAAHEAGLANILVSNGFMSEAAAQSAKAWVDAANIDLKAFSDDFYRRVCGARLQPVLDTIGRLFAQGIWLEVTTLIIPGLNDDAAELQALARFLAGLSPDLPWHLSAFHPACRLQNVPPTPTATLLRARDIGRAVGLRHVYLGNVRLDGVGDTLCPACGSLIIRRQGYCAESPAEPGRCPRCGLLLAGRWQ